MRLIPDVPVVFGHGYPKGFVNDVNGWAFDRRTLNENLGQLLTLDIDFGWQCSLNCPHCFKLRNGNNFRRQRGAKAKGWLSYDEILGVVGQAKDLGLRSLKILGAGEPLQQTRDYPFLSFMKFLQSIGVTPLVFTKGHVFANDKEIARRYGDSDGITTGKQLAEALYDLGVSILLGFNAFDTELQDSMVGVQGYALKRNQALELLVRTGFNKSNPTRLCLAANPIRHENLGEILEIYKWARPRNMYVIVCPSMISGRGKNWTGFTPSPDKLVSLYEEIYRFNLASGMQTMIQLEEEGIASYAGGHPCNQVSCGVYVTLDGQVLRCPGDDTTVFGDIRAKSLEQIWMGCENYGRAGCFNAGCPPKWGRSLPTNLFTDVRLGLRRLCESQEGA